MVSTCMPSAEVSTRGAYLWGVGRHGEHMHAERGGLDERRVPKHWQPVADHLGELLALLRGEKVHLMGGGNQMMRVAIN